MNDLIERAKALAGDAGPSSPKLEGGCGDCVMGLLMQAARGDSDPALRFPDHEAAAFWLRVRGVPDATGLAADIMAWNDEGRFDLAWALAADALALATKAPS